jgi:hypothetical protein
VLKAVPAGSAAIAMLTSSVTASLGQDAPTTPQDDPARLPVSQRPHPEFEPLGVRWNSLLFYPSVKTRAVFDSNVFSTAQNPQHDFAVVVSPGVTVRSQTPTASYQAEIGADIPQRRALDACAKKEARASGLQRQCHAPKVDILSPEDRAWAQALLLPWMWSVSPAPSRRRQNPP